MEFKAKVGLDMCVCVLGGCLCVYRRGVTIWIFIAMIRKEITKGTNLDEKEKSKEKVRRKPGRESPRGLVRKNGSVSGGIFGCHN